ncbi:hypothetical protein [Brevundimonas naejangsanensis]|uniref:hypothetical protein n=1 Tax=Brevundimonas naejangsanensis TaxID=588932 RepID=UPI001968E74A|nr:hypothetical protein [Brevundimonas naejangsanensis]
MKAAFAAALTLIAAPVALSATAAAAAQQDSAERARIEELTRRLNGGAPAAAPSPSAAAPSAGASPAAPPPAAPAASTPQTAPAAPAIEPRALSAADRAALPFRMDLPTGFQLVEGRAAPGARIYSARKAGKTYLMIYAGPSSQFPIYDGERVTAGGRVSVVTPQGERRVAMEHLFQRSGDPAEIHVWLMSLEGAERDEAERIAQTVDPK